MAGANETVSAAAPAADPTSPPAAALPSRALVRPVMPAKLPTAVESGPSPTELWGRVVDANSKQPVVGAEVELRRRDREATWYGSPGDGWRSTCANAITDGDGGFVFPVRRADVHRVDVHAAGYGPKIACDLVGGTQITIEMSAPASVVGVVTADGVPVVGAEVSCHLSQRADVELARVQTNARGAFRVDDLPTGTVYLAAAASQRQPIGTDLKLRPGEVHEVQIALPAGETCRGRVLDEQTTAPIEGAEVADTWSFRRAVRTDADGAFALGGLARLGGDTIYVRAPEHVPTSVHVATAVGAAPVEIRLPRGVGLTGRFVDARGRPLPQVQAAACSSFSNALPWSIPGHADWVHAVVAMDGRFTLSPLGHDRTYWLSVRCEGCGTRAVEVPVLKIGDGNIDLGDVVMEAAAGIEGRVFESEGTRVFNVQLEPALGDFGVPPNLEFFARNLVSRTTRTDDHGCFRFTDLAPGWYELSAPSTVRLANMRERIEVKAGERRDDIVLTRRGISGHLLGPGARPLAGFVWIEDARGAIADAKTDAAGRFWFDVAADFRGALHATVPGDDALQGHIAEVVAGQDVVVQVARR
jgi:hypothetical protein